MPHVLNVQSLYYNKSQLHAAGFSGPPGTLEAWYRQMLAWRRRGLAPYTASWAQDEGLVSDFVRIAAEYGGDLFDADGKPLLQQPPAQRAAAFMRQLIDDRLVRADVAASNEPDAMRAFLSGGVSFTTNWHFACGAMNDSLYSQIVGQGSVAPIPAAASTRKTAASVSGFLGLAALANSAHPDLAVAWLRYLTSPEGQAPPAAGAPISTPLQNPADLRKRNPQNGVLPAPLANGE